MGLKEYITIMRELGEMKKHTWNSQKWENTIIEMKHCVNGINSKTDKTEDNISELKGKTIETIILKQKVKTLKKINQWDSIKCFSICVIEVVEGEEKERRLENIKIIFKI